MEPTPGKGKDEEEQKGALGRKKSWATRQPQDRSSKAGIDDHSELFGGGARDLSFIPLINPWRRERLPTPVFWPGEFHGLYSPWCCKELDMTERLSLHFSSVIDD